MLNAFAARLIAVTHQNRSDAERMAAKILDDVNAAAMEGHMSIKPFDDRYKFDGATYQVVKVLRDLGYDVDDDDESGHGDSTRITQISWEQ